MISSEKGRFHRLINFLTKLILRNKNQEPSRQILSSPQGSKNHPEY